MLRGAHLSLRIMMPEEVTLYALRQNDPRRQRADRFRLVSPARAMAAHIRTSFLSEEETVLIIDLQEAAHVGYARWFTANPAAGTLEVEVVFYSPVHDTPALRSEALALICGYLFDDRPVERVQLVLLPEDEMGKSAATRAGFVKEGTLRQMVFARGRWRDLELWSVLREELCRA